MIDNVSDKKITYQCTLKAVISPIAMNKFSFANVAHNVFLSEINPPVV